MVAVGGDVVLLGSHGIDVIPDEYPGEGPLGGIVTALRSLGHQPGIDAVVVVACDLPNLGGATVGALVSALSAPFQAAVAIPMGANRPALCGAWSPAAATPLAAAFAAGERRVRVALDEIPHVMVHVDPAELRNVNAPDDLGQ